MGQRAFEELRPRRPESSISEAHPLPLRDTVSVNSSIAMLPSIKGSGVLSSDWRNNLHNLKALFLYDV